MLGCHGSGGLWSHDSFTGLTQRKLQTNLLCLTDLWSAKMMREDGLMVKSLNRDCRELRSVPASTEVFLCAVHRMLICGPLVSICFVLFF